MARMEIRGDIIPNDDKWFYEWLEWDCTCPRDVENAITAIQPGEKLEVVINSGGGSVFAGQEIYSRLKKVKNLTIEIQSLAGSAASIIAMAGKSKISPIGVVMIHNVSMSGASGDYHAMQKNAEILKQMNAALANAYTEKTGRTQEEVLKMMDRETWLTANQCVAYGFVDEIATEQALFTNSIQGMRLTDDIREKVIAEKKEKEKNENMKKEILNDLEMYGV